MTWVVSLWSSLEPNQIQARLKSLNLALTSPVLGRECVVCLVCGYAVSTQGNGVTQHLWEQHQTPKYARHGLSRYLRSLGLADPKCLQNQPDYSQSHPLLRVQQGAACRDCSYRSLSELCLSRHLVQEHQYSRTHGGWMRGHILQNISLQSWPLLRIKATGLFLPTNQTKRLSLYRSSQ